MTLKDDLMRNKIICETSVRIKIQCPVCGHLFIFNEYGKCYCIKCRRIYSEKEIRERCGI